MQHQKHYLAAVSAFVIWGFFPLLLRTISEYSSGEILYFRILFSSVVLATIIFGFKRADLAQQLKLRALDASQKRSAILLTLLGGALLTVNWLTFIYIVNNVNIKTASFSYLICPVITAVLGYVILRERMTTLQWIAVALCAISCALMGWSSVSELGYSVLTAFSYALYLISQRRNQGFDRMIILGVQMLFAFFILNLCFPLLIHRVPSELKFYGAITLTAVMFTVLPLFLNLFALNKINSATIGVLMYINPFVNYSVAFIVFHESVNEIQIIGYSIIFIALILFNYPIFKKIKASMSSNDTLDSHMTRHQ